ncbi:MAG: hypothetical protein EXR01_08630 [Acetobacteraceae bacterium]|nr:hypothetical protein [Acetobacteraceae bacterium]
MRCAILGSAWRRRIGDWEGAVTAMEIVLSRYTAPGDLSWAGLADTIAPEGWCALTGCRAGAGFFLACPAGRMALAGRRGGLGW